MTRQPVLRSLALGSLAALMASTAFAQTSYSDAYYYFGLGAGRSRVSIDDTGLDEAFRNAGLTTTSISRDEKDTAYKVFGGYQFNRNFALELGYFDLGKFGFAVTTLPAGSFNTRFGSKGANLDLVGSLPITDNWSVLARVGAQYAKTRLNFSGTGPLSTLSDGASKRETNGKYGLGVQYAFSPGFMVRGEVERYRVSDAAGGHGNVGVTSLSLLFPLGRVANTPRVSAAPAYVPPVYVAPPPPPVVAQAPPPVVMAPAPVPVVQVPSTRRVSFSSESLFGFDQSELRADGKAALDKMAIEMAGTRFDSVVVEGYTDRLGSTAYNEKLSLQRAEAVKAYLVSSGNIDGGKISTVGKGESAPVTKAGDCVGNRPTPKLTACLQPDRRVDVEVTGMR